jgi:hypothetical protein
VRDALHVPHNLKPTPSLAPSHQRLDIVTHSSRRKAVAGLLGVPAVTAAIVACGELTAPHEARAGALSNAWQAIGGGPPDLFFPDEFLGRWKVRDSLSATQTDMGNDTCFRSNGSVLAVSTHCFFPSLITPCMLYECAPVHLYLQIFRSRVLLISGVCARCNQH